MAKSTKSTKKRPKSKLLTKVVFLVLLVVLGTQLYRLQGQIQTAQEDQEQLTQEVEQLRQKNAELAQDIENGDDPALKEEIAREELGMVNPSTSLSATRSLSKEYVQFLQRTKKRTPAISPMRLPMAYLKNSVRPHSLR